jgi:VanZ family protein
VPSGVEEKTQPSPAFWRRVWADGQVLYPVILAVGIVSLSGTQSPPTPGFIPSFDKLAHFCVYGLLATLIFRLIPSESRIGRAAWLVILVVSLFGLSDEIHQAYTPGRYVEFADWVADTLGAGVAVFTYWKWDAYRRILEIERRAKTELTGRR